MPIQITLYHVSRSQKPMEWEPALCGIWTAKLQTHQLEDLKINVKSSTSSNSNEQSGEQETLRF